MDLESELFQLLENDGPHGPRIVDDQGSHGFSPPSFARVAPTRLARGLHVILISPPGCRGSADPYDAGCSRRLLRIGVRVPEAECQLPELRGQPGQLLRGFLRVLRAPRGVLGDLGDLDDAGADLVASPRGLAQVPPNLARGGQLLLDGSGDRVGDVLDLLDRFAD